MSPGVPNYPLPFFLVKTKNSVRNERAVKRDHEKEAPSQFVPGPSSCRGLLASCSSRHSKHTRALHSLHVSM